MDIIDIKVEKKSKNPLEDILDTLLNLYEASFLFIKMEADLGLSFYYDDEKIDIPLSVIFDYLIKSIPNYEENSAQRERLEELLESRSETKFSYTIAEKSAGIDEFEYLFVQKSFEILKDDELIDKFKNFDANKETFLLPDALAKKSENIENYLRVMISIFGNVDKEGQLIGTSPLLDNFYIPDIEKYKESFIQLYKTFEPQAKEVAKKLKRRFDLHKLRKIDDIIYVYILDEEPEWKLNDEIKAQILDDMPKDMSAEEKAIYIYTKMCKVFAYDEGYIYREQNQGDKINYTPQFSKEHLEALTPESRITCFDFSRIYKKIIDDLGEEITALLYWPCNRELSSNIGSN